MSWGFRKQPCLSRVSCFVESVSGFSFPLVGSGSSPKSLLVWVLRTQSQAKVAGVNLSPAGRRCVKCVAVESGREEGCGLGPAVWDTAVSQMPDCRPVCLCWTELLSLTLCDSYFPPSLSQNIFEVRCKVLQTSWTVAFFCFTTGSMIFWQEFRIWIIVNLIHGHYDL